MPGVYNLLITLGEAQLHLDLKPAAGFDGAVEATTVLRCMPRFWTRLVFSTWDQFQTKPGIQLIAYALSISVL